MIARAMPKALGIALANFTPMIATPPRANAWISANRRPARPTWRCLLGALIAAQFALLAPAQAERRPQSASSGHRDTRAAAAAVGVGSKARRSYATAPRMAHRAGGRSIFRRPAAREAIHPAYGVPVAELVTQGPSFGLGSGGEWSADWDRVATALDQPLRECAAAMEDAAQVQADLEGVSEETFSLQLHRTAALERLANKGVQRALVHLSRLTSGQTTSANASVSFSSSDLATKMLADLPANLAMRTKVLKTYAQRARAARTQGPIDKAPLQVDDDVRWDRVVSASRWVAPDGSFDWLAIHRDAGTSLTKHVKRSTALAAAQKRFLARRADVAGGDVAGYERALTVVRANNGALRELVDANPDAFAFLETFLDNRNLIEIGLTTNLHEGAPASRAERMAGLTSFVKVMAQREQLQRASHEAIAPYIQ